MEDDGRVLLTSIRNTALGDLPGAKGANIRLGNC
jgi:hypothetical protein